MNRELDKIAHRLDRIENKLDQKSIQSNNYIDVKQVSIITGYSVHTIRQRYKAIGLQAYHFGRMLRFKEDEVYKWLENRIKPISE